MSERTRTIISDTDLMLHGILPCEKALEVCDSAAEILKKHELNAAICVVNSAGEVIACIVTGPIMPYTRRLAELKARQAAFTATPTDDFGKKIASGERSLALYGIAPDLYIEFAGGVPFFTYNRHEPLGAIGVSNLDAGSDKRVAIHAINCSGLSSIRADMPKLNSEG